MNIETSITDNIHVEMLDGHVYPMKASQREYKLCYI